MCDLIDKFKDWVTGYIPNNEVAISADDWVVIAETARCGYFAHTGYGLPEAANFSADLASAILGLRVQDSGENTLQP